MSTARYQLIASSPRPSSDIQLKTRRSYSPETPLSSPSTSTVTFFDNDDASERGTLRHLPAYDSNPKFRQKTPSPYARAALIIFVVVAFYFAFVMRAEIFWAILDQQEKRVKQESEKWADWASTQVCALCYVCMNCSIDCRALCRTLTETCESFERTIFCRSPPHIPYLTWTFLGLCC
jgi:hypothetical protein